MMNFALHVESRSAGSRKDAQEASYFAGFERVERQHHGDGTRTKKSQIVPIGYPTPSFRNFLVF